MSLRLMIDFKKTGIFILLFVTGTVFVYKVSPLQVFQQSSDGLTPSPSKFSHGRPKKFRQVDPFLPRGGATFYTNTVTALALCFFFERIFFVEQQKCAKTKEMES